MERRLREVLEGKGDNYILPFFWQHGETKELLEEGMEKIRACGIRAVCVESRPHPDFLGDGWWRDMDIILNKAGELGMRVWVLDDAHFPSGYCNGKVGKDSPYGKRYLDHYTVDAVGPMKEASFLIRLEENETFVGAVAARRDRRKGHMLRECRDISDTRRGDVLEWEVPEGFWCVTVIKTTSRGTGRPGYINTLDQEAVRYFLDTVYEPHYAHYREEFGRTFAGFFSDEPEIGNCCGEYGHFARVGQPTMPLPWCRQLEAMLRERWGKAFCCNLIAMWNEVEKDGGRAVFNGTGKLRAEFMDCVTQLYGANFCGQIGEWCRARGVEYIGHVIEDGGCHARLGLGTGHYFRALWGQDMAGIDVVLQQIRPGLDDTPFYHIGGKEFYYGEFYHHGLAKMGVSLAHLDPKKKGRTMCEVFGAYGWSEGVKLMKWLVDHMLVRGVNYFVPHAFTMKDFPDPDCPPHFYARGNNPQFPYFGRLMRYLNRVCHLLNGGVHRSCAAVLYTAELEWIDWDAMQFETVGRILAQNQVDYEVLPVDILPSLSICCGKLVCGAPGYDENADMDRDNVQVLVIPACPFVPRKLADWCRKAAREDFSVICVDALPAVLEENGSVTAWKGWEPEVISLEELGEVMKKRTAQIRLSQSFDCLRYYRYGQKGGEFYLFFNESPTECVETEVGLPVTGNEAVTEYDAWENCLRQADWSPDTGTLTLTLLPGEMKLFYMGEISKDVVRRKSASAASWAYKGSQGPRVQRRVDGVWKLSLKKAGEDKFVYERDLMTLKNVTASSFLPRFSGTMKYETEIILESLQTYGCEQHYRLLDLGQVYETAQVWVNGTDAGCRIAPPYVFDVEEILREGKNTITVLVTNTLVHQQRDAMSVTMPVEPSGLLGPVSLV